MSHPVSRREQLLAIGLTARRTAKDRRALPDRRSGLDRRRAQIEVQDDRRLTPERRQTVRRRLDREEGSNLLQKARSRLSNRFSPTARDEGPSDHGLR